MNIINIGNDNYVSANEIKCIFDSNVKSVQSLRGKWKNGGKKEYIDITARKKTRSVIVTDDFIYASNISPKTLAFRIQKDAGEQPSSLVYDVSEDE